MKSSLTEAVYSQRKNNIMSQLKRLLPGRAGHIAALKDPCSQQICTDDNCIARILTEFWQATFDAKATDASLRSA